MNTVNVLITGAGGDQAVFIWKALKKSKIPVKVVGCDCNPLAVGLYRADPGYLVPRADSGAYLERVLEIIDRERVDIVLPGNMLEMEVLLESATQIKANTGAYVVAPPKVALDVAKDKWVLVDFLKRNDFAYPISAIPEEQQGMADFLQRAPFPYIVKDRFAAGSRGLSVVNDNESLQQSLSQVDHPIVQEYLFPDDEEYTVGCFCGSDKKAVGSIVMKRILGHGLTNKAEVLIDNTISEYCETIAERIGFVGPANLQLRLTKNGPVVFEINPRFSSTESARAYYNYNMPEMCIRHFVFGEKITPPKVKTGFFFRIFEDVFVDSEEVAELMESGVSKQVSGKIIDSF